MTCALVWLAATAAFAWQPAQAESVRFSNIRFDTGDFWTVEQQFPVMILRPANPLLPFDLRIEITPAAPFPGTLEEARDTAWEMAVGGRETRGNITTTEERSIPGDGIEREIGGGLEPLGGLYVAAVKSGDFATSLTLSVDTNGGWQQGVDAFLPLLASLEIVKDEPPPSGAIAGAPGGSGAVVTFDWDGPDRAEYGIYDHGCLPWVDEFKTLVNRNSTLVGLVAPQATTWQTALDTVRSRLAEPGMKAGYEAANEIATPEASDPYSAGAAASLATGNYDGALAHLFAGVEKKPDDPNLLFNFAAALNQNGMPNESLAVLARVRSYGKQPKLAAGLDAEAALSYLEGYAEMLLGNLAEAKSGFQRTIGLDPFLNEASQGLALIQAHEGNAAAGKKTYQSGMWRFKPKQLVSCGGKIEDDVRPPVDDMFDTSRGVEGRLVEFWHPDKASDLEPFFNMVGALASERLAIAEPLKRRMMAMGNNPRFAGGTGDPYDAWADKMSQLIEGLDEDEPFVLKFKDELEKAIANAEQVAGTNQVFVLERIHALALTPGNHCPTYRSLISNGIRGVQPHAVRVEQAFREYARVWFKIATGLNSNIGDQEWFDYNHVSLRATLESMSAGMLSMISVYYAFPAGVVQECPEDPSQLGEVPGEATPPTSPCDQIFGNLKFKHSFEVPGAQNGPKFGFEVGCDKMKADVQYDLLAAKAHGFGTGLGGFASFELTRKGDYTIFAGARGDVAGPLTSGGIKSGVYVKGNSDGLTDLGGRVELGGKFGPTGGQMGVKDTMDFNLLSTPKAAPRGPSLKSFRAPP